MGSRVLEVGMLFIDPVTTLKEGAMPGTRSFRIPDKAGSDPPKPCRGSSPDRNRLVNGELPEWMP